MKAKKKRTRLWSILLVLVMVVGMLPTTALAEGSTPATEPPTETETADFTSDDYEAAVSLLGGADKATWDSEKNTLTLSGVNFTTTAATAVNLPEEAIIVLTDGTTNTITGGSSDSKECCGIYAENGLTISGNGTLTVTGGEATGDSSYGIYAEAGIVTISGGTVTANGGTVTEGEYSYGIYAGEGEISISGGTLIASAMYEALSAFPELPKLYWWRTSDSGSYKKYTGDEDDINLTRCTYVEIRTTAPLYTITVTGGTASVGENNDDQAAEGATVTLTADAAPSGKKFDKWVVESGSTRIDFKDASESITTFTMPAGAVSVKATYKSSQTSGGTVGGGGGGVVVPVVPAVKPSTEPTQSGNTTSTDVSGSTVSKDGQTTTTVDKQAADKLVETAVANKSEEIVISAVTKNQSAASDTKTSEVALPANTLQTIAEKTTADIVIKTDVAEVKFDNKAAEAVASQAQTGTAGKNETVSIVAEMVKEEAEEVRIELKVVTSDGALISDFKGGNATVTVNVPKSLSDKKIVCVYIDENGYMHKMDGRLNSDGTYSFTTSHFSTYAIMSEEEVNAAIKEQKEAVKALKLKLRTQFVKTKSGKKAIKLTWTNPSDIELDGVEIYRSVKKNSGYGKKPIFVSKSGKYINTAVKSGKKYYYKVRGFVTIDGEKVYTEYSAKAYRTVK